ncbi:hypothetical protein PYCCODRAFT_1434197 [Trametes coccinea BRFM310]|uniref:DUF6533 domain-containing protein n=1 Tax=Trametes coccinea (strain BRFM310) TaxID=1353009 RepID=A0A1Y2IRN1_TRAC3|nr:hypothetical protein PYCCODRAFT_1434197 [Trametes coccinea BRFM310]
MSSEEAAELVATYQSVFIANAIANAVTAFLVYDWLLCLDEETHFIWPRAKSGASVLYLLNRYLLLLDYLWDLVGLATLSDEVCSAYIWITTILQYSALVIPAVFSCLRVYALTGRNKWLSGCTLVLGLMPFFTNWATIYQTSVANLAQPIGCAFLNTISSQLYLRQVLISRIPLILSDLIVVAVTWVKLLRDHQFSRKVTTRPTLHRIMLENGTLYFLVLLGLNILQVVFTKLSLTIVVPSTASGYLSYIIVLLDPLTSILVSHFILNLRAANDPSSASIHSSFVDGELQFAQQQELVNSMDGPVHTLSNNHSQSVDQIEMEDMGVEEDMGAEERTNVEERDAVQV